MQLCGSAVRCWCSSKIMLPRAAQVFERVPRYWRRHKLMKLWMSVTGEDPIQPIRIRHDAFGYADLSDGFIRLIVINGDFGREFFRIGDSFLNEGGDFFDVGANHGLLSLGLAHAVGDRVRFHLFEPNPKLVGSIAKSLTLYPSALAVVNCTAVSDSDGVLLMRFLQEHSGESHVVKDNGIFVPSVRLDTYLEEKRVSQVQLLKVDVEGWELRVLMGAEGALRHRRINAVYFEYCEKWLARSHRPEDLLDFVDSLDYAVCFCRSDDLAFQGVPTHTVRSGLPGHGLPLIPINGRRVPPATDLLAIPKTHLVEIQHCS
jgi:FkbM family methyltransferase